MHRDSTLAPILGHLAWLAECVASEDNAGRAYDASLLTYNAAAMLQWRFVAPVSYADTIRDAAARADAAKLIDSLVTVSRRLITQAREAAGAKDDVDVRTRLAKEIRRVVKDLPPLLLVPKPAPVQVPELEAAVSIADLVGDFLDAHKTDHADAIARGQAVGRKGGTGQDAAFDEAIATLIIAHDASSTTSMPPELRQGLARIAAGFFKTAVEMQPEDVTPEQIKRWRRLADLLVAETAVTTNT